MKNPILKNFKEKHSSSKNNKIFSRSILIFVIILYSIPVLITIYSVYFNDDIKIGIVLTDEELYVDGTMARDGLNEFENIFNARILDVIFNDSSVRISQGNYLTNDYFDARFAEKVREKFNVDIIVIITNNSINNWQDDGEAIWGQADTKNAMALVTARYYRSNISAHYKYMKKTTIHEVLHILGYEHPTGNEKCVMQYASIETELCPKYRLELPYRAVLWKIGNGQEFAKAIFLIKLSMFLIFSPIFIATMILVRGIFKKFIYKMNRINPNPLIFGIGLFYFNIILASIIKITIYSIFIYQMALLFLYVLIEAINYQYSTKKGQR